MLTKTSYHARRAIGRPRLESQGPDNSFDLVQLLEICSMQRTATPRCNVQAHPFLLCGAESSENEMKKIREARETQKRRFIKICSPSTCTIPLEIKLPTEDFGFVFVAPCLCLTLKRCHSITSLTACGTKCVHRCHAGDSRIDHIM